jgi:CheY-like chemotaxis protein
MAQGATTILIVDDNDDLRALATVILEDLGHRVREARNADEALTIVRSDEAVDLLFTDIVMPGAMNGFDLARAAKTIRPGLKVIYTTGYSSRVPEERGRTFGPIVYKPYRPIRLAAEIRRVLDGGEGF